MVIPDLPEDIMIDIFSRMPTKSVGRCRCLSSTWRALLSTPHFIKSHLAREKNHPHLNLILFKPNGYELYGLMYSIATIEEDTVSRRITLPGFWSEVVSSCDDLVLLVNLRKENFLVNPVTLSMARIPNPPLELGNNGARTLGFGYDSQGDDYKICYFPCKYKKKCVQARNIHGGVFCETGAWKTIKSPPYRYSSSSHGAFVNGALHWFAVKSKVGKKSWCVSALNLASEVFFEIPIPTRKKKFLNIACLGGYLCILNLLGNARMDIWIMEKYDVAGAWFKSYHVYEDEALTPLCYFGPGEFVGIDAEATLAVVNLRDQTSSCVSVDSGDDFYSGCAFLESLVEPTFGCVEWEAND